MRETSNQKFAGPTATEDYHKGFPQEITMAKTTRKKETTPTPDHQPKGPVAVAGQAMEEVRSFLLKDLVSDPTNARLHDDRNLSAIRSSLQAFGQVEPLVVQKCNNRVIGGNGRLQAMRDLGWDRAHVVVLDVDDARAASIAIALNRTAELATWDNAVLAQIIAQADQDAAFLGFSDEELALIQRQAEAAAEEASAGAGGPKDSGAVEGDPGPQLPPKHVTSAVGDLWLLGPNRLLCGDSTKAADLARLMNGEIARLLCTDPPYLVDYDGTNHPADHTKKKVGRETNATGNEVGNKHWDAYIDQDSSVEFFNNYIRECLVHCDKRVPIYQWHATRRQVLVEAAWKANKLLVHQTVIWVKPRAVLTRSHMLWKHEPCFYGWIEGNMPEKSRRPDTKATTVWEIAQESDGIHPTQKPLRIFLDPITWHTRKGEVVLEPFSGSGSQLIAAHSIGRRCFGMELSPGFVDAIIGRFRKTYPDLPVTLEDGTPYDDVVEARKASNTADEEEATK